MTAPALSVVVPTFRRPRELDAVLTALARSAEPLEAIVVDDPEDDDPAAVAAAAGERAYPLRIVHRSSPGVSAARNDGWRAARAAIVLFLGDDIVPAPDLPARHLAHHAANPAETAALLGRVRWATRPSPFMRWLDTGPQFDYGAIEGGEAGWGRFYTANVSVKRALLERAGGFDEAFTFGYEDLDLALRMDRLGMRLAYDPHAVARHLHEPTLGEWKGRVAQVAAAERRFVQKHPEVPPYFHELFTEALRQPPASGRGARLARFVPRRLPLVGTRAWTSAELSFKQALAPPFLAAWEEAGGQSEAASSAGRRSSGPK